MNINRRDFVKGLAGTMAGAAVLEGVVSCARERLPATFRFQSPWINDSEFIGYFAAIDNGWYTAEGLDLHYQPGGPETIVESVLLTKRAEIAVAPMETVAKLVVNSEAPLVVIGTQYQKSPVGIVSLEASNIHTPTDLVGRKLAVPAANLLSVDAMLRINNVPKEKVTIVPYQYDPTPLIKGEVDATLDFVTNVPFTVSQAGKKPNSFLLHDFGFKVYNDVVVVTQDVLSKSRPQIVAWLKASRRGWDANFADTATYPRRFMTSYFAKTGRTVENEIYFNGAQKPLIAHPSGVFAMTDNDIQQNIDTLSQIGISVPRTLFDQSLLQELAATTTK